MENGYRVWTCKGRQLHSYSYPALYHALWRPRPPMLLSDEKKQEVLSQLRDKYWRAIENIDEKVRISASSGIQKQRNQMRQQFVAYREEMAKRLADELQARADMHPPDEYEEYIEYLDTVMTVKEVPV